MILDIQYSILAGFNKVCDLYKKKVFQFLQGSYSVRLIINGILVENVYCRYREQCLVLCDEMEERSFTEFNISVNFG
jgi:hypothetical protein